MTPSNKFNRLQRAMICAKKDRKAALIPFVAAGDPSLGFTEKLILELERAGADVIEIGVPFSDPIADGPTIQAAFHRALRKNVSLSDVFRLVRSVRRRSQIPLVLMLSYTLIFTYGLEKFVRDAAAAGVDGVIPPDLPPEEGETLVTACRSKKLSTIFLVAPTSTPSRIRAAAKNSSGFVYLVSVTGITGARQTVSAGLPALIRRVRRATTLPVAVGFGISTPEQARAVAKLADGVVVGSALVNRVAQGALSQRLGKAVSFVSSLDRAIS